MNIIVMKFGGTSVGNISKIKNVAKIVAKEIKKNKIIVVLSAMGGVTNKLQKYIEEIGSNFASENDLILTSGEQVSVGLLSAILKKKGIRSLPLLGWQIPIVTDNNFEKAKILNINKKNIKSYFKKNDVIVLAGFQGVNLEGNITSLGRGGSDTTAVAIAAAMDAKRCDIFTDVDGVFSTDPNVESKAKKIDKLSFEEMLEMASMGAKVLQTRSVELAMKNNLTLQVLSSLRNKKGTFIIDEKILLKKKLLVGLVIVKMKLKLQFQASLTNQVYLQKFLKQCLKIILMLI